MCAGRAEVGLETSVGTRATAGKTDEVIRAVRAGVRDAAAVRAAKRLHVFRRADADDVLARAGRTNGGRAGTGVARCEDDDHFLIARVRHGRAAGLRVADERVVILRVGIVSTRRVRAPTVVAHARAIAIRTRREVVVIRRGEIRHVKNHRGTELHERADAEAVMIAARVGEGRAGQIVVAADDVGVEIAVAIAALQRAAGIRRAFEAVIDDAAGECVRAAEPQAEMVGRNRAVINAAVRHVHDKARSVELRLREAFAGKPREVAGAARHVAGKISRHDLRLPLAEFLARKIGLDGNHVGIRRQFGKFFRRQFHENISVAERGGFALHRREFQAINLCERVAVRGWVVHELNRKRCRSRPLRLAERVGAARGGIDFPVIVVVAFPLHE